MEKAKRYLDIGRKMEAREAPDGRKFIEGLIPYNSMSEDLGGFREQIDATAFRKTLADGANVYALWSHNDGEVLGSTKAGTLTLENRDEGLAFSLEVRSTAMGDDRFEAVKRGDVIGTSFGFFTERDEWDHLQDPPVRTLKEVRLLEISPGVPFPAYPGAKSGAVFRSVTNERPTLRILPPESIPAPPEKAPEEPRSADLEAKQRDELTLITARWGLDLTKE